MISHFRFLHLKMKKIYYLSSCNTCNRILKVLKPKDDVELIDIKKTNIDEQTLDWIKEKAGSYENLFSKKAIKYRTLGLNNQNLTEKDFRKYILEDYTFLKRPYIIANNEVVVGNSKEAIEKAKEILG